MFQVLNVDAKLCFALLASLRSAIFSETEADNKVVALRANSFIFNPQNRMDMLKIKSLLSVLEPEDANQACGEGGFDIIYRLQTICQKENFPRVQVRRLILISLILFRLCKNIIISNSTKTP